MIPRILPFDTRTEEWRLYIYVRKLLSLIKDLCINYTSVTFGCNLRDEDWFSFTVLGIKVTEVSLQTAEKTSLISVE